MLVVQPGTGPAGESRATQGARQSPGSGFGPVRTSKSFSISSGAAPRSRMSIIVPLLASSERSTTAKAVRGVNIPRMINLLLEGIDPARRPLLFSWEFWPVAPSRDGSGSIVQIWLLRDRQFARTLLNRRKQLRQLPSAIAGYSAWSIMIPLRQCLFGVRGASRSWGAVRRDSAFRHGRKLNGAPSPGARPK